MTKPDSRLDMVNASGFLFQLRVAHEVQRTAGYHPWQVIAHEHRWEDPLSGADGYIDLVLGMTEASRIVVECKRVRDANWVFLTPTTSRSDTRKIQMLWTDKLEGNPSYAAWSPFWMGSDSPLAEFCVIRGQGERDAPMLERICGSLLQSVESLASNELRTTSRTAVTRFYKAVIITNATLQTCTFDQETIDLASGNLPDGDFTVVPFVRFRKSLPSRIPSTSGGDELLYARESQERTVFVVNASHIHTFLAIAGEASIPMNDRAPWQTVRLNDNKRFLHRE
jgi:hypothetical protein